MQVSRGEVALQQNASPEGMGWGTEQGGFCTEQQETPISMGYSMAVRKKGGKNSPGLSRRFSLIVLRASLDSDFQCVPAVSKIQMCECFILLISLASPKNFGLSWIILSHCVMTAISFSQQSEKLSQKNWKQTNPE